MFQREETMSFDEFFSKNKIEELNNMKVVISNWRIKKLISASIAIDFITVVDNTIFAAEKGEDISHILDPLLVLLQKFALPISIVAALWGAIEYMSGKPGGVEKIKKALIGLIAIFIIPYIFRSIAASLSHF
jgi:hypothetical protein